MPEYPHPATVIFGVTGTQSERLLPPDDSSGWMLLKWRPFPVPTPQPGTMAVINMALWAKPKPGVFLCGLCLNAALNGEELPGDNPEFNLQAAEEMPKDENAPPCGYCGAHVTIRHFVPKRPGHD